MVKDPVIIFVLIILAFKLLIRAVMQLSPKELTTANTLQMLYNKDAFQQTLTTEKKRTYLKIWKNIIQPKTNKYKILKIHFINHVTPLIFYLVLTYIVSFCGVMISYLGKPLVSEQIQILVSGLRQVVYLGLIRQVLLLYRAYPRLIRVTRKNQFLKMVSWCGLLNLYFVVPLNLTSEIHFVPVGLLMFFAFKILFTNINCNRWGFMYRLNVHVSQIVG